MQRYEIVNGVIEVEGAANETTTDTEEDKGSNQKWTPYSFIVSILYYSNLLVTYVEKGVPSFWLNAMKNNDVLAEEVSQLCSIVNFLPRNA